MTISGRRESLVLFVGDIIAFAASLFLAFLVRYGQIPGVPEYLGYLTAFSFLIAASLLVYFIAGLYDKHTLVLAQRIPATLAKAQAVNAAIAIAFFYFFPFFSITPKTFLFIYLVVALALASLWRIGYLRAFSSDRRQSAVLIADGAVAADLYQEVNGNPRYGIAFTEWLKKADPVSIAALEGKGIRFVAADFNDPSVRAVMPQLYGLFFKGIEFADVRDLYEGMFDRIPLSLIDDAWCLSNVSASSKPVFDLVKRLVDLALAGVLACLSLVLYPFVIAAIKADDGGVIFSYQTRIGQRGMPVRMMKFRTMSVANDDGKWGGGENRVTKVGRFLRKSRIDELPQLWNVFKGDISLIGPRPEFPDPVAHYSAQIPYYNLRHIVKPGLSGWAQIYHERHPHHGLDTEETANKLSYDLYYIKNRSLLLDLKIALRTMKVLLSFAGK